MVEQFFFLWQIPILLYSNVCVCVCLEITFTLFSDQTIIYLFKLVCTSFTFLLSLWSSFLFYFIFFIKKRSWLKRLDKITFRIKFTTFSIPIILVMMIQKVITYSEVNFTLTTTTVNQYCLPCMYDGTIKISQSIIHSSRTLDLDVLDSWKFSFSLTLSINR